MSTAIENQSSIVQSESDGTVKELHKQPNVSYTREFLISLAELDTCKQLPCGLELSILRESGDASNCSSQSSRDSDSGKCYDNLSRHSWQTSEHDGILGAGAFPRLSGCLAGAAALIVREKGCLLHRSDEPYRPPRPNKAVPHFRRQINDSYNDVTFCSSEHLSQEITEEERRRKASFEWMRKEQQNRIQEKQNKISDHEENLDPDMVALLQESVKDKRPVDVCNEYEQYAAPAASNNNSANRSSIEGCATIPTITPGFTSRFFEENLDRKCLTHSTATKSDYAKSLVLCSSAFAPESVKEEGKHGSGMSSSMRDGSKVYGMPQGNVTETNHLLSNGNELSPKLRTCTSQSAKVGISEQLYGCNKPTVTTDVLTCGDLELSFLSKISENGSTQHHYGQDSSINDTENGQPNSPNQRDASQHLLSLLQKGTVLTDLAASPDKSLLFEVGTDSNVISIFSQEKAGKSDNQEALHGTSFAKELQLTDASLFSHKGSPCRVTKDDASLPCGFASPVMDNSFFPSKVDEYGPSVVNQEGIMSSSYNKQTDSSEMMGNKQVSDDFLAKIGSKVQPKEGLKLNPVSDLDEKSDSTIEICLPDEDSLITFDDYSFLPDEDCLITGDDFRLPSDENSLFSPTSQVHNGEKPSGLNVTLSHEKSSQLHSERSTANRNSYGLMGLEPSNYNWHAQQSYPQLHHTQPQLHHTQPYTGETFLHSVRSQTYLHSARNSMKAIAKSYPCNHSPHQFRSTNVLPSLFQQTHGEPTMFDHPVNHMLLQQMSIPGKLPPRQLNGHPRGVMPDLPVNQLACYRQELNPMQDICPTYEQPNFAGLGMPNQYFIDPHVARDDNHRKFNALFKKELGASFTGSGRGPRSLGNQIDIAFWYEQ